VIDTPRPWNFGLVEPEIDNARAVLEWSVDHDPARGLHLAAWLEAFWVVRDPVEGAAWLEQLLELAADGDAYLRASALRALGGALDILGQHERPASCYSEALELFSEVDARADAAHLRFRVAANMVLGGETDAAWPLLEEALSEARSLGSKIGEAQALGFFVQKAYREGDLELALSLALDSAELAREAGWGWWEAGQLETAAMLERERGNLDAARTHAHLSFEIALELRDRQHIIFAAADLAAIAAADGQAERAGRLWGAIETEVASGQVGQWEREQGELEALVLAVDGPAFAGAREEGRLLSIAAAVGLESA